MYMSVLKIKHQWCCLKYTYTVLTLLQLEECFTYGVCVIRQQGFLEESILNWSQLHKLYFLPLNFEHIKDTNKKLPAYLSVIFSWRRWHSLFLGRQHTDTRRQRRTRIQTWKKQKQGLYVIQVLFRMWPSRLKANLSKDEVQMKPLTFSH